MIDAYGVLTADEPVDGGDIHGWAGIDKPDHFVDEQLVVGALNGVQQAPRVSERTRDADVRCWVLGEVFGFDHSALDQPGGYAPKPTGVDAASYCLDLLDRYGPGFVDGLNGNFTLILHDSAANSVALCTDRLGTVPVYYTRPDDDRLIFSTSIQDLPQHPAVDTSFHPGYLHEYLAFRHAFGVKTPLTGIETFQPGTISAFDLADGTVETTEYWRPRYRPREDSFDWFVDEFTRRFQQICSEWMATDDDHGVLLSGGSDSRLVLAGTDDATAFHMNGWLNREAQIAEQSAHTVGADFEFLQRDPDYRVNALERNNKHLDFIGWFTQAYTTGFEDEITERVDRLLTGLYGDTLFKQHGVPSPEVSLGPLGSITLPAERRIESVDDYVDMLLEQAHDGLDLPTDLRSTLEANIYRTDDSIVHHGVTYDSLDELVYYDSCYPLANDNDIPFYHALRRALPSRTPFLDNRLIDLSLSMPIRYRLRRNVIDHALDRLAPDLAAVPHAETGVQPARSFPVTYLGEHLHAFWRTHVQSPATPEPYMTEGSWPDDAELLRANDCFADTFKENRATVEALPGLSWDDVCKQIHAHENGDNRTVELYTLLSVMSMPVTEHVISDARPGQLSIQDPSRPAGRATTAARGEVNDHGR